VVESRRSTWTGYAASTDESRNAYNSVKKEMKGRDHFGATEVDGKIILKCIIKMGCEDVD
jgi:hypothetical protein